MLFPVFGNIQAEILRVNNQLTTNHQARIFNSLQLAHDFAQIGDTLMVEGSPTTYSAMTLSKRLTVIGTGYFINENFENPSNQLTSRVNGLTFNSGSQGSILLSLYLSANISVQVSEIVISRCRLERVTSNTNINSLILTQNYFSNTTGTAISIHSNYSFSNFVFENNFVNGSFNIGAHQNQVFSSIKNNIFLGVIAVTTDIFQYNIIVNSSSNITINSNNVSYNLTSVNQLSGNGNQIYDPNQLFIGPTGNSTDGQYQLKTDSPYLTAGFQGVEPGIFGGNSPYILSGLPPLPVILNLSADSFGTQQNGLNVSIKAKTNN